LQKCVSKFKYNTVPARVCIRLVVVRVHVPVRVRVRARVCALMHYL